MHTARAKLAEKLRKTHPENKHLYDQKNGFHDENRRKIQLLKIRENQGVEGFFFKNILQIFVREIGSPTPPRLSSPKQFVNTLIPGLNEYGLQSGLEKLH